jgi:hypothetical protein
MREQCTHCCVVVSCVFAGRQDAAGVRGVARHVACRQAKGLHQIPGRGERCTCVGSSGGAQPLLPLFCVRQMLLSPAHDNVDIFLVKKPEAAAAGAGAGAGAGAASESKH